MDRIKQSPVKYGIILVVVLAVLLGGFFFNQWWNTPLGTPLDDFTPTVDTDSEKTSTPEIKETATKTVQPTATAAKVTETATPRPEPLCGGPEELTLLFTGIDSSNYTYGLADAIRIVQIDFMSGDITVLPLPRDLWVEIPISVPGVTEDVTHGKLNQAYFYGTPGMGYYDSEDYGPGLLAKTLETNFDLKVDHYFTVNVRVLELMVDQIGGLPVYLPNTVYKHYFGEPRVYLEAGSYLLTGKQAEMVARHRTVIGDFGRQKNQTILLKAFIKKMFTPEGIKQLPNLVEIYQENVLMDFSPKEISQLICLAAKIELKEDVHFLEFPQEILTEGRQMDEVQGYRTYALTYEAEEIQQILEDLQAGKLIEE